MTAGQFITLLRKVDPKTVISYKHPHLPGRWADLCRENISLPNPESFDEFEKTDVMIDIPNVPDFSD